MASRTGSNRPGTGVAVLAALTVGSLVAAHAGPAAVRARFRACLVTGSGGPDAGADRLAVVGLEEAEAHGVRGFVVHARSSSGYAGALRACLAHRPGLTIAVGYLIENAVDSVATAEPHERFAAVDVDVGTLAHRPPNVVGLLFRDQQSGYLVGYAAGLWARAHRAKAVGAVGGIAIPPVDSYIAGFDFGAKLADPGVATLTVYSEDFTAPAKCKSAALGEIAQGADVELEVAGACGAGVLEAAREKGDLAIRSGDATSEPGSWVMTSALERVDAAVVSVIARAKSGTLRLGVDERFGAAGGGIAYGAWSTRVPARIRSAVARQFTLLREGRVHAIPATLR